MSRQTKKIVILIFISTLCIVGYTAFFILSFEAIVYFLPNKYHFLSLVVVVLFLTMVLVKTMDTLFEKFKVCDFSKKSNVNLEE